MKTARFCEILGEICWRYEIEKKDIPSVDEIIRQKQALDVCKQAEYLVYISVQDEQARPLVARVVCEQVVAGELKHFFKVTTNDMGFVALRLQEGVWNIRISKGAGYSVHKTLLTVDHEQTILQCTLTSITPEWYQGWTYGDIHHHSVYSSRLYQGTDPVVETPQQVKQSMQAAGLGFGALSDHHNTYNHNAWKALQDEGFVPIFSKEISTSRGHIIALNTPQDVIFDIPDDLHRTDDYMRKEFVRVVREIKTLGGMAQLNHPCDRQKAISWNPQWMDLIGMFDTMEVWNASKPMIKGSSTADAFELWLSLLDQDIYLPATTGSDTHNTRCDDYTNDCRALKKLVAHPRERWHQWKPFLQDLQTWQTNCLGSGETFVCVCPQQDQNAQAIVNELKCGHSVLSNGPMLSVQLDDAGAAQTTHTVKQLHIRLRSNEKMECIRLFSKTQKQASYSLKPYEIEGDGYWEYSHTLSQQQLETLGITFQQRDYLVVWAEQSPFYMAISNPILICQ